MVPPDSPRDARLRRRDAWGRWAERLAALWLQAHGCSILARRASVAGVEVDVLARRGALLLVVEVKSRTRRPGDLRPDELVSPRQRRRLERAAAWLEATQARPVRLDVLEIRWTAWPPVRWHRAAWIDNPRSVRILF